MEVQEGKDGMHDKIENAAEDGVFAAFVQLMAEGASVEGVTLFGDAWFGSLKGLKKLNGTMSPHMPLFYMGWALTFNVPHACRCCPWQNEAPLYRCCEHRARPLSKIFPSRIPFQNLSFKNPFLWHLQRV
jgi:hypothetical protein